ncbi:spore germination protein [Cohnella sp. SGD-V74]|uniref:GerAB/ArcD/ProY family transporter n=1 Tax=unclassified Cohnella TaxID=2636738 RepID=UPI000D41993D|nr:MULTISPECIES: GerAB/ArcD/ProY family transporter [unclassified Cohnella]PRX71977.1 spore germination protein [Cohnella sp. SGD-V74]
MQRNASRLPTYLFIVGTHTGLIFFLYAHATLRTTAYAHWQPAIVYICIEALCLFLLLAGLARVPGKDFADLFIPLGKVASLLLLAPLVAYFLLVSLMVMRSFAELVRIMFVANTPMWALLALLVLLFMFGAFMGGDSILRANVVFSALFLPVLLFALSSCFKNADFHYLYPLWNSSFDFLRKQEFYSSMFVVSPFLVIGMLPPLSPLRPRGVFLTMLPIWALCLIALHIPILVFGTPAARLLVFPFLATMDSVSLLWLVFDRVTLFYAVSIMAFVSVHASFLLWSIGRIVHKRFPKCPEKPVIAAAAVALFVWGLMIPGWDWLQNMLFWETWLRILAVFAIPAAVLWRGLILSRRRAAS